MIGIFAVIPVKEMEGSKQRLSSLLTPVQRQRLAEAMLEDVVDATCGARDLAGIIFVTRDVFAMRLAERVGAHVITDGARDGHTGAVVAAARRLVMEGGHAMLTMPGDVPRVTSVEIQTAIAAHHPMAPAFTIVPAHDEKGSNCIIMTPPDAVPLRFGEDSYFPHLDAARRLDIEPSIVRLPGIGMDIDHPEDVIQFMRMQPVMRTRTLNFLQAAGIEG
ncbi:MAG: 2-phospho-L-lactate guanylyltransferase [Acetobacteraceae bacterium]|nr:2-phospho-L-lactate guanylyltransferase [Acetobacteraceae bacterium]MSP29827.1 2-phospho-L-lactate guanylyltransferase [Acetobacteraceae bacterium]